MKQVAGQLKMDMALFRELAAFAQFGSDLDPATLRQLNRGRRMQEILKQAQYEPVSLENQVVAIFAGTNGFADEVPLENMRAWEIDLLRYMQTSHPEVVNAIAEEKRISDDTDAKLRQALETFKNTWQA